MERDSAPFGSAAGGSILGNHPTLVGEHEPELFTPSTAGNITPNHCLGAAQPAPQAPPVVNTTTAVINVMDPKEITGAINSSEGERVILNVLSRNRASLKSLVS